MTTSPADRPGPEPTTHPVPRPATVVRGPVAARPVPAPRPVPDRRRATGELGEDLAVAYLTDRGWDIVARNWRLSSGAVRGELDVIATRDGVLAFVEVKTRRSDRFGPPAEAVTRAKQDKIRTLALAFLAAVGPTRLRLRFDVIAVVLAREGPQITHLPAAF